MKQVIKSTAFLLILMSIFTSSQEKARILKVKCAAAPSVAVEKSAHNTTLQNEDSEMPIMPISRFILLQ